MARGTKIVVGNVRVRYGPLLGSRTSKDSFQLVNNLDFTY